MYFAKTTAEQLNTIKTDKKQFDHKGIKTRSLVLCNRKGIRNTAQCSQLNGDTMERVCHEGELALNQNHRSSSHRLLAD